MGWLSSTLNAVGLGSGLGSALNEVTGVSDSMKQQAKYNERMWNLQNEYNSPAAQLARMREAGIDINPTSYALGSGNLSNTASTSTIGTGSPAGNPISMLMGVASGLQGLRESKQRTDNMKEQNTNLMQEGLNLMTRGTQMRLTNDIMRHNLAYAKKHGLPVNSVPGLESSGASLINEIVEKIRKDVKF